MPRGQRGKPRLRTPGGQVGDKDSRVVTLRLTPEHIDALEAMRVQRGQPRLSSLIRQLLTEAIQREGALGTE